MSKQDKMLEEFRALKVEEIKGRIKEAEAELFGMKFNLTTGQLENTAKIENTKRKIARLQTVLTEKAAK